MTQHRRYNDIGTGYALQRLPDPRWGARIRAAIGGARTMVNVGAGTGSYEPTDLPVTAVEPSEVMVAQRPPGSAPAVRGVAEALPFADRTFDVAVAILTVHHWTEPVAGLREMQRIAPRQVTLTWDPDLFAERMWLVADYLPQISEHERDLPTLAVVLDTLGPGTVLPMPVPAGCTDGVLGAHWARPQAYLDPSVRAAASSVALIDQGVVDEAMRRLESDLSSGAWNERHGNLLDLTEFDLGYRLVITGTEG